MKSWKFFGYDNHVFNYDTSNGYLSCSCGKLGTRLSAQQSIPTSERHVRHATRSLGSLVRKDL